MAGSVRLLRSRGRPAERLRVAPGTALLEAIRAAGLPLARGCGGSGLCGRCGVRVHAGAEALSPEGEAESRAKARNRAPAGERLACQARVHGDCEVSAAPW